MDRTIKKEQLSSGNERLLRMQNNGKLFNARKVYHYKTTVVKSIYAILTIITVALLIYLTASVISDIISSSQVVFEPFELKVRQGDTLWSLAKEHKPDGISFSEYWDWVLLNNDADIYPGDIVMMATII